MAWTARTFNCSGTSEEPHDVVYWNDQWDTLTSLWITDDGKASPCWMCGKKPDALIAGWAK